MPTTFGEYLKRKRVSAGLSVREVAQMIGVSHVTLGEVERGERPGLKRERWKLLEEFVPGFSVPEVERLMATERPIQLDLRNASPGYQRLGLELARRMERRDLMDSELEKIMRLLRGGTDDE